MNVNDSMLQCYESPEFVHKVLRKVTDFIRLYALEFKNTGAHGIVPAEPLASILSPAPIGKIIIGFFKILPVSDRPLFLIRCST